MGTDVFVICFSLVSPETLQNVEKIFISQIKNECPKAKYILVGMFSKSRDEFSQNEEEFKAKNWQPVTTEQGQEMKSKIGAFSYIECDVKYNYNVNEVFYPQKPYKGRKERDSFII